VEIRRRKEKGMNANFHATNGHAINILICFRIG
jgi:hypothetical protein